MKKISIKICLIFVAIFTLFGSVITYAAVYKNRTVDFSHWSPWTVYGTSQVNSDFGNTQTLEGGNRLKINSANELRFFMPKGKYGGANAGGIFKVGITGKTEYTITYKIRFSDNFPWSKGGKIPGLSGGEGYTGGTPAWAGDGFSVRIMWRSGGKLVPYVYHMDQPEKYGDNFDATLGYLNDNQNYTIKYWVKLNTGNNNDGVLKIYIDNVLKFKKSNIRFRNDRSKIDTAHLSVFPGGDDSRWAMKGDGYIYIDDFTWK